MFYTWVRKDDSLKQKQVNKKPDPFMEEIRNSAIFKKLLAAADDIEKGRI